MKVITRQLDLQPEYDLRSICPREEMLLFDIETTGLKKETTKLYLIGCAWAENGIWNIRQYLTENAGDEYYILEAFLDLASGFKTLVHFNGDSFDIPYIQYKCEYYGTETDLSGFDSFDIYKAAKCARRFLGLASMSQKSIEQFLRIRRDDRYSGGLLIPVYYQYELTGAPEQEEILLLHNYDDIQGMLKILPILAYKDLLDGRFVFESAEEEEENAVLFYRLQANVPVPCEYSAGDLMIGAEHDLLKICLPIRKGTGLVPLDNVSDYYYLPEEDRVIHKDLAQFLERSRRVKATRKTCVLKKEGRFVQIPAARLAPAYYFGEDRKNPFADWDAILEHIQKNDPAYRKTMEGIAKDILDLVSSL